MRVFACALAASLLALAASAGARPLRVASLNLCTDELLLDLAAPGQIVSLTHLSQDPLESPRWQAARHYPANDGSLLSVVGRRPDLVVTMGGGARDLPGLAKRLGIKLLVLPYPQSIRDIDREIVSTADALGRPGRANRLLMRIRSLRRTEPKAARDAVFLSGGGRSLAATGLGAQWMRLAGLRQRPLAGDRITLEQLLVNPPAILLRSDYRSGQYSAEQGWLSHPLARTSRSRTLVTDGRRWTCMGPSMVDEVLRLRKQVRR